MNTNDRLNKDQGLQVIAHKIETSPVFEADIDPIALLQTLDGYIDILGNTPADPDLQRIQSELQSLEIITMTNGEGDWWMNEPIVLHQYVMKRSMGERLRHLYKSKGEWKNKHRKKDGLEVSARVQLPLRIGVPAEQAKPGKTNEVRPLLLSIIGLRNTIEVMLEGGATSSGVFFKPEGVVQMNKIIGWLEGNEQYGSWSMKDDLNTKNLYDIIHEIILEEKM
jgi:hypothetical protein